MAEDGGGGAAPADGDSPQQQQTVPLPLSAFPAPPKPGQVCQFKVISIDQNAGAANAVYLQPEPGAGGSDSLAAEFNQ